MFKVGDEVIDGDGDKGIVTDIVDSRYIVIEYLNGMIKGYKFKTNQRDVTLDKNHLILKRVG